MHRAVTTLAAALLALAATAALALAQGGAESPGIELEGEKPTRETLYEDGHSARYLLGGQWYFRLDPGDLGEVYGLATNPTLDGWQPTTVPNAWNATDMSDDSMRGSIGWYRKDFVLPSDSSALSWKIRFESVNYRAKVWLNGEFVGEHEGAYVPFEVPTLDLLEEGVNSLVIRVDSRRGREDVPKGGDRANGRPGGGWWNYGGLLREVYLRRFETVDVESVRVRTELDPTHESALLRFRARLDNPTLKDARVRLRFTVDGIEHETRPVYVPGGSATAKTFRLTVLEPRLWEPLEPQLYPVAIDAMDGDRRLSGYRLNVGIRDLRVSDDGLLLINGRQAKLFGASIHEDHPDRGAALLPADRERDMRLVRALGASIIRSHYPLHPHYLELADRMGVMVWDQVPVYSLGYKGHAVPGVIDKSLNYIRAMIARDQNHPSVLAWSIANELSARMTDDQEEFIRKAARLIDKLDPTRLRTIDIFGWPQNPPADVYRNLDAIGINNYFGWYPGPNGQSEDRERLGPFLDQMREYYPELALFITEFGAEANRSGPVDEKGTYAFQRDLIDYHVKTYLDKPYINGAVTWILRDFRVRPDWEGGNPRPEPPWNQKGLVDENWRKKPAFGVAAKHYKAVRPLRRYRGTSR